MPVTKEGTALRNLYDHYGYEAVLSNPLLLTNGFADLVSDTLSNNTKRVRNNLRNAMDAGIGQLYQDQISAEAPDKEFYTRIKMLLTEYADMSEKSAERLMGWFDEMIGWAPERVRTVAPEPQRLGRKRKSPRHCPK